MPGVEAVAEGVADDLGGHHSGLPRLGQANHPLPTADGLIHALQGGIYLGFGATESERKELSCLSATSMR